MMFLNGWFFCSWCSEITGHKSLVELHRPKSPLHVFGSGDFLMDSTMGFITMKSPALNKREYVWVTFFQPPNHSKSKSTDFGMTFFLPPPRTNVTIASIRDLWFEAWKRTELSAPVSCDEFVPFVVALGWRCSTGWWFQTFVIFILIWGRFPFWLIFFKWVETTK